jgi:hypothetical protein
VLVPFAVEAIQYCFARLSPVAEAEEEVVFVPLSDINKKQKLKSVHKNLKDDIKITQDNCFYFYQARSGEAIYLHPLCLKILEADGPLPVLIE